MVSGREALEMLLGSVGVLATAAVDLESGRCLLAESAPAAQGLDLRRAAHHNAKLMRARLEAIADLGVEDEIEDDLLTVGSQYHLVRFVPQRECAGLFLYLVADRHRTSLALVRRLLADAARDLRLDGDETEELHAMRMRRHERVPVPKLGWAPEVGCPVTSADSEEPLDEDELPPFMRTDSVLRLLGIEPAAPTAAPLPLPAAPAAPAAVAHLRAA